MIEILSDINTWGKGTLFKFGFLESIFYMLLFVILAFILYRIIRRWINKKAFANTLFIIRIVKISLSVIAGYGCLSLLTPFDSVLSKIWGSAGIIAVVVGLAAQESMGNFVNGLLISTFKPFKIGDLVKVDNGKYEGYVVDISLRDTVIQTYENTKIIIPNSTMNKSVLENVSETDQTKGNFLTLDISYESDLDLAMRIIKEEVVKHPSFLDPRSEEEVKNNVKPVVVRLTSFNESSMTLRTTIYSRTNAEGFAMLSDLRIAIKKRFDKEGIEFPYPHCTITYKNPEERIQK